MRVNYGNNMFHLSAVEGDELATAARAERYFALDLLQQVVLAALEVGVGELDLVPLPAQAARLYIHDLVEVVHVELPDKRGHVGVLVVVRQHGLSEFTLVLDYKRIPVLTPGDQIV